MRCLWTPNWASACTPLSAPLKELHDDGEVATIPGCGYPNPNRSHFASMDIWHTADRNPSGSDGWLGRYFDTHPVTEGSNEAAIAIGNNAPRALTGSSVPPIAFQSAQQFRWTGADIHESLGKTYQAMSGQPASTLSQAATANPQLDFLVRTNMDAQIAADRIRARCVRPMACPIQEAVWPTNSNSLPR